MEHLLLWIGLLCLAWTGIGLAWFAVCAWRAPVGREVEGVGFVRDE